MDELNINNKYFISPIKAYCCIPGGKGVVGGVPNPANVTVAFFDNKGNGNPCPTIT